MLEDFFFNFQKYFDDFRFDFDHREVNQKLADIEVDREV